MKPFFTVIIPTLNEEQFVGKLLGDLAKQQYKDYEVLVVDAKSEDKTIEVIRKYRSTVPIRKVVQIQKRNVSTQRNKGASLARGSFFVFLDADARIDSRFLHKLHSYISVQGGLLFIPALRISRSDPQLGMIIDLANTFVGLSHKTHLPFSTGGSMVVEKNLFFLIKGFPEDVRLNEDHLLVRSAYKQGVIPKFLLHIKIQFSLRRFQREGKMELLYKYVKSAIHFIIKGKEGGEIIEYEMGGHLYKKSSKKMLIDLFKSSNTQWMIRFNKTIQAFLRELTI